MNRVANIVALFSLRRISGQIAALILVSLVLIHVLIAGFFLLNRPMLLTNRPMEQFELAARIMATTPRSQRGFVLQNIDRTFPALKLQLREGSPGSAPPPGLSLNTVPSPLDGQVDILRGASSEDDRVWYYLPNDEILEGPSDSPSCRHSSAACGRARCCSSSQALRFSAYGPAARSAPPSRARQKISA
ncbi:hypothetical protein [Bradyrhizobium centrolobii]|uniref:hypothetical protein n=1 Tax=Bradyrhizobium centrolobii TaxID=1505087 RepID=UPI003221C49E